MIGSFNLMKLLRYSVGLYKSLEAETGQAVDFHECGSVRLALTEERLDEYRYRQRIAQNLGVPYDIIGADQLEKLWPLGDFNDALGAA
jgi:dimethylglycine dehydrogenase